MTVNGEKLILYIDGKPIEALSGVDFTTGVTEYTSCTTEISGEYRFEVGKWETPEFTPIELWEYNFWRAKHLPRKKKKAYRKKLIKMLLNANISQSKHSKKVDND